MIKRVDQSQPLVSIGILSYNRAYKIGKTIESILNQNYGNLEILISDDASTDGASCICRKYIEKDKRIILFEHENNIGPYNNYEFLVKQSKGKYFMWMSDDDELKPNIIHRYVEFLERNTEYNLVCGQIQYWKNGLLKYVEKDLSQENDNKLFRVLGYYSKVSHGAIFYGLMRRVHLKNVKFLKNKLAGDWHVVAHMAYLSKIKQLDFVSINKNSGGFSANWEKYAEIVGASKISSKLHHFVIGLDTLNDIMHNSRIYNSENKIERFIVGLLSCMAIWTKYYVLTYPKIIGGKIKRFFLLSIDRKDLNKLQA
ncbi:MAG TPA: glycosyltransferase family 2 protein [Cyclobacteriaceae bacterium]|nr:glycosyltransferase family 2 protein [Cyclobacteriaceae bacterium]